MIHREGNNEPCLGVSKERFTGELMFSVRGGKDFCQHENDEKGRFTGELMF